MSSKINSVIIIILLLALTMIMFVSAGMLGKMKTSNSGNNEITLGIGEAIKLEKFSGIKLKFAEYKFESACPEGAQCIWAGEPVYIVYINGVKFKMNFDSKKIVPIEKYDIELINHDKEKNTITLKIKRKV